MLPDEPESEEDGATQPLYMQTPLLCIQIAYIYIYMYLTSTGIKHNSLNTHFYVQNNTKDEASNNKS